MKRGFSILWLLAATASFARQGVVETRDGKSYEGQIRLYPNRVLIANAARDFVVHVELTNLLEVTFKGDAAAIEPKPPAHDELLPSPWKEEDIGSVQIPSSLLFSSGIFRMNSSGTNILGGSDAFHFVYKPVKGNSELVARIINIQYTDPAAQAGLMMRESLKSDARNVLLAVTPGRGGAFQWREASGEATHVLPKRDLFAPYWIKLKRQGDELTGYKSRNGRSWIVVEKISLPMTEEIYVGLAMAGVKERKLNRSTIDNLREAPALPISSYVPRLQLQSGSTVMGRPEAADESAVHFRGAPPRDPVSTRLVANILFQWVPHRLAGMVNRGRPGVLLTSGEFVDGEFKGIENGQVRISSVLFGLRSFSMDSELIALVLRKPAAVQNRYEVKTFDGSVWLGTTLEIAQDEIVIRDASLGDYSIPVHELGEIRRR